MTPVRPKKHFGQHFLTQPALAERITQALVGKDCQHILEVGPGKGILTQYLLQREDLPLTVCEIDSEAIAYLEDHFPALQPHIVAGDFLHQDWHTLGRIALIGNFPYNISSQILFKVWEAKGLFLEVVGMFQKEVSDRVMAPAETKSRGILSVLIQAYFDVEPICKVPPGAFHPPPKVQSSVIRLQRNDRKNLPVADALFKKTVKTAFGQRRKKVSNALNLSPQQVAQEDQYLLNKRAEELSVDQFVILAKALA